MLTIPENEIVKQNEPSFTDTQETRIYYIAKGEFTVEVQTQPHMKPVKVRDLNVGDHFGEISMLYKCKRTASVVSRKYATLGYLTRTDYKKVIYRYQEVRN